jgi:hypothetical protein
VVGALGCGASELLDRAGFGQVAPIVLRHVAARELQVDAGRIEDGSVIARPPGLDRVVGGSLLLADARAIVGGGAIPAECQIRGQDGKPHAGESVDEERGGPAQNVVPWLIPRDVDLAVRVGDCAKAEESGHPVLVVADSGGHPAKAMQQWVDLIAHQCGLAMVDPPKRFV